MVVGNPNVVEAEAGGPMGSVEVWNHSQVPTSDVLNAAPPNFKALIDSLGRWAGTTRGYGSRNGGLFDRDRYVTPNDVFSQMRLAYDAVETDDVVGGVVDTTESLAFSKVDFHALDPDEQDVYNQIARDIDLDSRLREMWRELFTVSQFYCAIWWHTKTYKVRGKNRKRTITLRCPKALSILDPLKIVPVGMPMFGRERLAWIADRDEASRLDDPNLDDEIFKRLILGKYNPNQSERRKLIDLNINPDHLYEMNPANVFRHTATRPGYQLFAAIRMKSVFELLDQKHQLRSMDRAHLIGGTNFIVLVTQGSDQWPLKPDEFAHLQASVRTVAQTPVLVGDHRLEVKIVTPALDHTLDAKRYDTIDTRIMQRLFQMFGRGAGGDRADTSEKLVKLVASGMESRRKMIRRSLEQFVLLPMFEANDELKTEPRLSYHPKDIALAFDDALAGFLLELRNAREISRFTLLNQFGMSEEFEADMLEREEELFDDIFKTINPNNQGQPGGATPTAQPAKKAAKVAKSPAQIAVERRQGGRKGGAAPGTGQGKAPRNPARTAADLDEDDDD
jgi:hypothetical protein